MRASIIICAVVSGAVFFLSQTPARAMDEDEATMPEGDAEQIAEEFVKDEGIPAGFIDSVNAEDEDEESWDVTAQVESGGEDVDLPVRVDKKSGDADWE